MSSITQEENVHEFDVLNQRLTRLAQEKSYLQLTISLINKMISVSGLDNIAQNILQATLSFIGGTNLSLYYQIDDEIHYVDIGGTKKILTLIDDNEIRTVFTTGTALELEFNYSETKMLIPEFTKAFTWIYPLKIGANVVGVLKIENLHISTQDISTHLMTLFNYMAMALKNEIQGQTKLKKAYDKIALEVTERRKTEGELKEAQRLAQIGSWNLDLATNTLDWSDEVYRIFNLKPQQFEATYEAFLDNIHPDDRDYVNHAYTESVKSKKPYDIVHRLMLKDGTIKYVNERCKTFYDDIGTAVLSLGTVQDITNTVLAEKQHLELEVQLRQKHKMEAVGYMAGGMAHNFNNNLGIILGNVELSLMKQPRNSQVTPLLKNAKIAVERSRDLIMKIITYSRQGIQKKAPMQLTTIIDETLGLLRSTLPTTVALQKSTCPECDSTFIDADASQIQEVLINLCNNAIQAMNEKGDLKILHEPIGLLQKEIPAQYDCLPGRYARLSVQDNGCGMPAEMLDKIFDPFYSTKEAHEGAGMGLATVQGIVVQHGGFIKVNSVPDQGTTFNLYFPIIEQTHLDDPTAEDTALPRGTERILFVDDDEMLASLGEKLLIEMGYQVVVMNESTEALKMFAVNSEHFDLVITDQTMPRLSGKDLIQELKKIKPDIPTILCTGYSNKIDEAHAKELGISAFMMKPLNLIQLTQTVRRVLDGVEIE